MRLFVITRDIPIELSNKILRLLKIILSDLEFEYPFFVCWLDKVFYEMQTSTHRKIIICCGDNLFDIYGVSIIKDTEDEKKICTLRVLQNYRRRGIGTLLLHKSMDLLSDNQPLLTVSEKYLSEFKPFLKKNGFTLKSKVKSLYIKGMYEYFFNKAYNPKVALISIKPKYVNAIIEGKKTVEFRKKIFSDSVRQVFIYSSYPEKRIVGYFMVATIRKDSPSSLWGKYKDVGCISKEDFCKYFKNSKIGYGIEIKELTLFSEKIDALQFDKEFKAPQSYCYINNVKLLQWLRAHKIINGL